MKTFPGPAAAGWVMPGPVPEYRTMREIYEQTIELREVACDCGVSRDNAGVCLSYHPGEHGRCVYCDHSLACHWSVMEAAND